jgi:hypothetical protein
MNTASRYINIVAMKKIRDTAEFIQAEKDSPGKYFLTEGEDCSCRKECISGLVYLGTNV